MKKYILIDFGYLMFRAILAKRGGLPASWTCNTMIISNLAKVGVTKDDTVIVAIDSPKGSWRREVDSTYKANRKENREKSEVNWDKEFRGMNWLTDQLSRSTPFHYITIDKLEADDTIAYACKKFKDTECIIISADTDFEQLCVYPKVRIFSPLSKKWKTIKNPYQLLAKKINKEVADNLTSEVMNEIEYERRNKIVNLISLPKKVEMLVEEKLSKLPKKQWAYDKLPFNNSLLQRWAKLYEPKKEKRV